MTRTKLWMAGTLACTMAACTVEHLVNGLLSVSAPRVLGGVFY